MGERNYNCWHFDAKHVLKKIDKKTHFGVKQALKKIDKITHFDVNRNVIKLF